MKKSNFILFSVIFSLFLISLVSGKTSDCVITANLVNQDPNPAVPGEEVKILFQLIGTESKDCENFFFEIIEEFPFSLNPRYEARFVSKAGTFTQGYQSSFTIPYTLRIDKDALDGENELKVKIGKNILVDSYKLEKFNITIKEVKTDFEIYVRDYDPKKGIIIFEVINTGNADTDSLILEIPEQENIVVRGSNTNILGILDSNEYTTASFEADTKKGNINFILRYNDETGTRRTAEATTYFNPDSFNHKLNGESNPLTGLFILTAILFAVLLYLMRKRYIKKIKNIEKRYSSK